MKKPGQVKTTFSTYQVNSFIGQGGNGYVYGAEEDGEIVAIKVLDTSRSNKEKLKRFENEYRFCSTKRHENIISVIDHGITDDGSPFIVMPKYEGCIRRLIGSISEDKAYSLILNILNGVEAAHQYGVTHRDIKPENILHRDSQSEIVLTDFGIAEFGEDELYTAVETKDGTRLANFQYAAPEQRVRNGLINNTTDIYSLGLIINEIFTGELPLGKNHKTISQYSNKYKYFDEIVEKMLQQNSSDRYQNISEIKTEISVQSREYISTQKISALTDTVIPSHEIDDPIVSDPMKITDVEWDNGMLTIHLNHQPNYRWHWALRNMGNYSSVYGKHPDAFTFKGTTATISARDDAEAQRIIDQFKQWLPITARVHENKLRQDAEKAEQEKISELRKEIEKENKKKSINEKLTF